jgi:ATP-grasp ribosomal peptide maturase
LRLADRRLMLDQVRCAYYRRPSRFEFPADLVDQRWATAEARMGFGGVLSALPRWLNHPADIGQAEYKPVQLAAAQTAGLAIPDTMITNDPAEAARFAAGREVIYKPLSTAPISGGRVVYTTPVRIAADDCSISHTAHLFQERLAKQYEVRLTVVDDCFFAARIDAESEAAAVDWRTDYDALTYAPLADVPTAVRDGVRALMARLRLRFGTFDFIVDPDGRWWFLEVNPNGQWAWIEDATGLPITAAITDALEEE